MDPEQTQPPKDQRTVVYRCSCGSQLHLDPGTGGKCPACNKNVSPRLLTHDLAMTMTIRGSDPNVAAQAVVEASGGDNLIGQTLGHFEIISPLGRGGMGQVYQALDKSLQRFVAVKVLKSGIGSTARSISPEHEIDLLLQEAVAQARVTHPNIATIYYVGKHDGEPFLAMELVGGQSLNKRLHLGTLPFSEIGPIALQISEALQFSLELDIIHGDIKPSNILIQKSGTAKLSDFGMARRASDDSDAAFGGTPNYLAPELLEGEKSTVHSDMYALGVTLFEMTFGHVPVKLTGNTISEWVESHRTGGEIEFPSPWPEHLPDQWQNLLKKLLAKDPADRYADYHSLISELKKLQPGSDVLARRVPRLIAAAIDYMTVLMFMAPIVLALSSDKFVPFFESHPFITFLVQICDFIPIVTYTVLVFFWRHSVGRGLMHIRVVNQYGMNVSSKQMAARSIYRMIVLWGAAFSIFFDRSDALWATIMISIVSTVFILYWLVDLGLMLFHPHRKSLHDLVFKTSVVLDTRW